MKIDKDGDPMDMFYLRDAVIEASKVWLESFDSVEGNGFDDDNLLAAVVHALQELEGE